MPTPTTASKADWPKISAEWGIQTDPNGLSKKQNGKMRLSEESHSKAKLAILAL
jgi:hypothetical protein